MDKPRPVVTVWDDLYTGDLFMKVNPERWKVNLGILRTTLEDEKNPGLLVQEAQRHLVGAYLDHFYGPIPTVLRRLRMFQQTEPQLVAFLHGLWEDIEEWDDHFNSIIEQSGKEELDAAIERLESHRAGQDQPEGRDTPAG